MSKAIHRAKDENAERLDGYGGIERYLKKLSDPIHSDKELLIEVESVATVLLVHVEVFLQQVDDTVVVAREQSGIGNDTYVDDILIKFSSFLTFSFCAFIGFANMDVSQHVLTM